MNEKIIGLIPAAGKGIRLGLPYPKELYPVIRDNRYKPIAQFIVDSLILAGIEHIVIVINETKHQLIGYFGNGQRFGCHISYVVQERRDQIHGSTSPGLANALDSAYHLIQDETVCFGMADTIIQPKEGIKFALEHVKYDDDMTLILFPTDRPEKFGMVRLDQQDRVVEIVDKPKNTDLTEMWGCIIWSPRFTEYLHDCVNKHGISDFAIIMNKAIEVGFVFRGYHNPNGKYIDLGTYDEILELDRIYRDG